MLYVSRVWNYFPKKNQVRLSNFFSSSNMLFITLFLANTGKKIGVTGLVSSQTAVKCGHGFGDHSQDGESAWLGLGRDTKWRLCYAQKRLRNAKPGNHLNGTFHVDKIHVWFKSQTLRMRYPFQFTGRPISQRNGWSFRVYMIPLRDFVPE